MSNPSFGGANVLLMGEAGTGKTYSIGTLVDTGIEVFYISIESGIESLVRYFTEKNKPLPPNLHWHQIQGSLATFQELIENAAKINSMSFKSLLDYPDANRVKYDRLIQLLTCLHSFTDERSGQNFGTVAKWGADRVLVIDGLTGLSNIANENWMGGKVVKDQKDWGIPQGQIEQLLRMICDGCLCHFVLLAHVEREVDQITGGTKITASTLGRALAPKLPSMFSDVVLATRTEKEWLWDNRNGQATVKYRNLPYAGNNPANFAPLMAMWQKNYEAFEEAQSVSGDGIKLPGVQ